MSKWLVGKNANEYSIEIVLRLSEGIVKWNPTEIFLEKCLYIFAWEHFLVNSTGMLSEFFFGNEGRTPKGIAI